MKVKVKDKTIELEPNSKPILFKRIIADGTDIALVFILFMLLTALILKTPIASVYNGHYEKYRSMETAAVEKYAGDYEKAGKELSESYEYRNERFAAELHGYLLRVLAISISEAMALLIIPLANKDRSTLGRQLAGVLMFSEKSYSKASAFQVWMRFLLILLFDSMLLYLLTGIYTFLLVPVLRLTEMLLNKENKTLCDALTGIKIIEKLSYDGIN